MCGPHMFERTARGGGTIHRSCKLDIFGDVDQYWPWPTAACQAKRFVNSIRQLCNIAHLEIVLGDGLGHPDDISFLESVTPNEIAAYLPSNRHDRSGVHKGGCQS